MVKSGRFYAGTYISYSLTELENATKTRVEKQFNPIRHVAPQNVFDHCAQTLRRGKLKLGDF